MVFFQKVYQNIKALFNILHRLIIDSNDKRACNLYTVISRSQNKLKDSQLNVTNSHLSTMTVPTFGLNCWSIALGELIKLSHYKQNNVLFLPATATCVYVHVCTMYYFCAPVYTCIQHTPV